MTPPHAASAPPSARELRAFAWSVGGAFAAIGAVGAWRGRPTLGVALGAVGVALWLAAVAAPARLATPYALWMRLALAMSAVTTPVLMAVVYFAVLTPLAVLMRLAGRRPIGVPRSAPTAWVERPATERRSDLRRQF